MIYRQGDIAIQKVKKAGGSFKKTKSLVLAEGEVTGHKHKLIPASEKTVIEYEKVLNDGLVTHLLNIVFAPAKVVHEEHDTITLDPGRYEVIRQREYDPVMYQRRVAD